MHRAGVCGRDGSRIFPTSGGSSGIWGYDFFLERLIDPRNFKDIMTYCDPPWISDYHFNRATVHRVNGDGGVDLEGAPPASAGPSRGEMLVVWGSVRDGQVILDPAFVVNGSPSLPEREGPYRVEGLDVHGRTEFSLSFTPTPLEYGGGGFVFLVPFKAELGRDPGQDGAQRAGGRGHADSRRRAPAGRGHQSIDWKNPGHHPELGRRPAPW